MYDGDMRYSRVAVFIDGENHKNAQDSLGWRVDNKKFFHWLAFRTGCKIMRVYFYTKTGEIEVSPQKQRFMENLDSLGVNIISVPLSQKFVNGELKNICDADPVIITDMVDWRDDFDTAVLVSGDGGFQFPLERLSSKGKKIIVVSTECLVNKARIKENPKLSFVDLRDIRAEIELNFSIPTVY